MTDEPYETDAMPLSDMVAVELDRRKLRRLVDDGIVTERQLDEAPIVEMKPGTMNFDRHFSSEEKIERIVCRTDNCRFTCKTFDQFSEHLSQVHLKDDRMEE